MTSLHTDRYRRFLELLRAARQECGLTQVEVAAALDRPQSWVSKSERGERRIDALELDDLARLYGRSIESLIPARR